MNKVLLSAAVLAALSSPSLAYDQKTTSKCPVTHDKYMAVKLGASYDEAVEIVGCEGDEQNRQESPGYSHVNYDWRTSADTLQLEFLNHKLWQKSFLTNRYSPQADCINISPATYADIKMGMSYADTVQILKCNGFEHNSLDRNDGVSVSYRWTSPDGRSWIEAQFGNDKLEYKAKFIEK